MSNGLLNADELKTEVPLKICNYCTYPKPILEFRKNRAQCRECRNKDKKTSYTRHKSVVLAKQKQYRANNPDVVRSRNTNYRVSNREACCRRDSERYYSKREVYRSLKSKPCTDCKKSFPPECMDFDHILGNKLDDVGNLVTSRSDRLSEEILKTELVCANCHRLRTASRYKSRKSWGPTRLSDLIDSIKEDSACADCKGKLPGICYDFDHIDPKTKEFEIGQARPWALKHKGRLLAEILKCELRCVNCHRIKTNKDRERNNEL